MVIVNNDKKIIDDEVKDYLGDLKSGSPAPGGGSVSALAGAQAAALLMMVCDLTTKNDKYADYHDACKKAKTTLEPIYSELCEGVDKDTDAFRLVSSAYKMPKDTELEKAARNEAIARGIVEATQVPLHNMCLALKALIAAAEMENKFNPNCASDYGVAVLNLRACIYGAWMNVRINLPSLRDTTAASTYQSKGSEIVRKGAALSRRLYASAESMLG